MEDLLDMLEKVNQLSLTDEEKATAAGYFAATEKDS